MSNELKFKKYMKAQKEYDDFKDQFVFAFWKGQYEKKEIKRGMTKSDAAKIERLRATKEATYKEWIKS